MALENLFNKMSDLAQTGVAKAKELTDVGVAKSKEMAEIGKLKVDSATQQEEIKKAYMEIGKLYFAERGSAPEAPYTALCEKITEAKAKLAYNDERIGDIKAAGDVKEEPTVVETEVPPEETPTCSCDACDAKPEEPKTPDDSCSCGCDENKD